MSNDPFLRRRRRMLQTSQWPATIGLFVLGALVLVVFQLGSGAVIEVENDPYISGRVPGPEALAGQALYEQYCFGCHGLTGDGNPAADIPALNQNGAAWSRTRAELEAHILDGGETMPELAGLVSPEDAARIIEFIQLWWTEEQIATFQQNNGQNTP